MCPRASCACLADRDGGNISGRCLGLIIFRECEHNIILNISLRCICSEYESGMIKNDIILFVVVVFVFAVVLVPEMYPNSSVYGE